MKERTIPRPAILVLGFALAAAVPAAQTQRPPARATGTIQAEATAILVDVVVRDKHGQPVTDLTASDFDIYEDGVQQEVGALTRYAADGGGRPAAAAAPAPSAAAAPNVKVETAPAPVIALLFDRLAPEARVIA